jgi:hypothetical protein
MNSNDSNPRKEPSVFELTTRQLKPVVEQVAGEPITSFAVSIEHQVRGPYGVRGEKLLPTFTYRTRSGRAEQTMVFAKRQYEFYEGHSEAYHYTHLHEHGAPVPRMYACLRDSERREILFLEYLDVVTEPEPSPQFINDPDKFFQFLDATACVNAITPSDAYAGQIRRDMAHRPGPPGLSLAERLTHVPSDLDRIWKHARNDKLGDALAGWCEGPDDNLNRLKAAALSLSLPVARMKQGLCINDLYPVHTGWRQDTGELLIFDLEMTGFEARFFDVAEWIGAPDEVLPRCRPRAELARYYMDQYVRHGGQPAPLDEFLAECHLLWMASTFTNLWWYMNEAINGPMDPTKEDSDQLRAQNSAELHRQLRALLNHIEGGIGQ